MTRKYSTFEVQAKPAWWSPSDYERIKRLFEGYSCPENMRSDACEVFAGCYDVVGLQFDRPPLVIDIGANCGAYMRWALDRWPGCKIHCYEPNPEAFEILSMNVSSVPSLSEGSVTAHETAVSDRSGQAMLRKGLNNLGEASFFALGEQSKDATPVEVIPASKLSPWCDVLKIDTEGCELDILRSYLRMRENGRSPRPSLVSFEYHREEDFRVLDSLVVASGYILASGQITNHRLGILNYVHKSVSMVRK